MFLFSPKNIRPAAESGTGSGNHSKKDNVMFRLIFVLLAAFALIGCSKDESKETKDVKTMRKMDKFNKSK
jgi:hypothetical protein